MTTPTLCVSIVSYFSIAEDLTTTVRSLCECAAQFVGNVHLTITDNTDKAVDSARLEGLIAHWISDGFLSALASIELRHTGKNLGYGQANNQALLGRKRADYVLVLNPDLLLQSDALQTAHQLFNTKPDCVLIAPRAMSLAGDDLFLNHAKPTILALLGRFVKAPVWFRPLRAAMERYELRELPLEQPHEQTLCASGCFMLIRRPAFDAVGGFDDRFFMYFEDYDLSVRLRELGRVCYEPAVRVAHFGGDAASKGMKHSWMFASSAFRFFQRHGWQLA